MSKTRYPPGSVWVDHRIVTGWVEEEKQYELVETLLLRILSIPEQGVRLVASFSRFAESMITYETDLRTLDKHDLRPATQGKWAMAVMKGKWEPDD